MAGIAKPNVDKLGAEVELTDLSMGGGSYSGTINGLFDGICANEWNAKTVLYWSTTSTYLQFTTDRTVNIWRSGTTGWATAHKSPFKIMKLRSDNTYLDVTSTITQSVSAITEKQWEKTISNLPKGTYRFYPTSTRIDSEWYVEEVACYLILMNDKCYTIQNGALVELTEEITDSLIESQGVLDSTICENLALLSGNVKFICNANTSLSLKRNKTNTEMIVSNNDNFMSFCNNIDYIKNQVETLGGGQIKIAFSINEGLTWKTYDGTNFTDLSITIPNKPYNELNDVELSQWNNARDIIYSNGIDSSTLNTLDFNTLSLDKIRFVYVLHIDNIEDVALNKQTVAQVDYKPSYRLMDNSEIDIKVCYNVIIITSKIDNECIKLNILTDGVSSKSGIDISALTDNQIIELKQRLGL